MATEIDRKLWLTAALVGAITRKDLAAAFRRVNPATSFEVERAHKWLQGRAQPRELRIYQDWARLVDLGEPAEWIADCRAEAFLDRICARHGLARDTLLRRAEAFGGATRVRAAPGPRVELAGTYACYSHAWSPYFRGRLIRGTLSFTAACGAQRLLATYAEVLPTGRMQLEGAVTVVETAIYLDLRDARGGARCLFCLFPPTPPASVLGGFMTGATLIGPEPQPAVTRIVMIRLPPGAEPPPERPDPYLPPGGSVGTDLAALGVPIAAPELVDRTLAAFLCGGDRGGHDQIPGATYRAVVELFDRHWLARVPLPA